MGSTVGAAVSATFGAAPVLGDSPGAALGGVFGDGVGAVGDRFRGAFGGEFEDTFGAASTGAALGEAAGLRTTVEHGQAKEVNKERREVLDGSSSSWRTDKNLRKS